jgi:hydroxymethylpyrimidine pyrophosphatase-like HAD family hydrolase
MHPSNDLQVTRVFMQVMAVGDGENDLEMLQIAGLGVAMANGAPVTLEAAHAHVGSNDEDGVAEAIERFILSR